MEEVFDKSLRKEFEINTIGSTVSLEEREIATIIRETLSLEYLRRKFQWKKFEKIKTKRN